MADDSERQVITEPGALNAEIAAMNREAGPGVPVFGHSSQEFKLPCGYVDASGRIHQYVTIRQMTGHEEDMIGNNNLLVTERITNVLASCCEKLGTIEDKAVIRAALRDEVGEEELALTAADRLAMMLFLRIVSVGENYRFDTQCPHCEKHNNGKTLHLPSLEIKNVANPAKRLAKVILPKSKVPVVLRILTAKGETEVARLKPESKDARTLSLMARIVSVNGTDLPTNLREAVALLKDMPYQDRIYLRKVFDVMEGAVDTEVEVVCNHCDGLYKFPLDLGQIFFSPQEDTVEPDQIVWM